MNSCGLKAAGYFHGLGLEINIFHVKLQLSCVNSVDNKTFSVIFLNVNVLERNRAVIMDSSYISLQTRITKIKMKKKKK